MFIKWSMTPSKVQDHFYAKIILAHLFMDRFWWKFVWMLISWRHNMWPELSLFFCHGEVLWFFTLRPSDLIMTLAYVHIDLVFLIALFIRKQKDIISPLTRANNWNWECWCVMIRMWFPCSIYSICMLNEDFKSFLVYFNSWQNWLFYD